ncbi:hypothetical protein [Nocardiopsis sp. FR26]|uniref:hypothetical protein n=1 Tax=Nocardiopsis sp. FR26 TaxID=2605987 RepID=UPI0013589C04|nr:hypothetical protein [Nocardiopsis sp. FR26]
MTFTHQELRRASKLARTERDPRWQAVSTWLSAHAADHTNPALNEPGGCPAADLVTQLLADADKQVFHFLFAMFTGGVVLSGPERYTTAITAARDAEQWMEGKQTITLDTFSGGAAVIRGGEIEHTEVLTPAEAEAHMTAYLTPPTEAPDAAPR